MPILHDFSRSLQRLKWIDDRRAHHSAPENRLVADTGTCASSLAEGLYLYLYSNRGSAQPIRNKNTHHHPPHGAVVCPPNYCTLKSGKFKGGLHNHLRNNVHHHLWRPEAAPPQDHIAPHSMCWFLAFETDPSAPAPRSASQRTREKYYNFLVRQWLAASNLDDHTQDDRMEHRWLPQRSRTQPVSADEGRRFLETILAANPNW